MADKLGVYIATHEHPLYFRFAVNQLVVQTRLPDVVAIHQNGAGGNYRWVAEDLLQMLAGRGCEVLYIHNPRTLHHPHYHLHPLLALYESGCGLFTKFDHDDIFFTRHLSTLVNGITTEGADCFVSTKSDAVILKPKGFDVYRDLNWVWNPTGGMSDAVIFNRRFAGGLLRRMKDPEHQQTRTPDDVLMGVVMAIPGVMVARKALEYPTACYVTHDRNTSGDLTTNPAFIEQTKEH